MVAFVSAGGWVFYNTKVLNPLLGPKDREGRQADYEKSYKQFEEMRQPGVRNVKYAIDIYPEQRRMKMSGDEVIYNPYAQPLSEIHLSLDRNYNVSIDIPGASHAKDDERLFYRIYHFDSPLQPGESQTMHFTVESKNRGFENEVSNTSILQNGTFFNNTVAPVIGYDPQRQLNDPVIRQKYGLKEIDLMPALEATCTEDCRENYLGGHSDWVDVESVVRTSPDQIAIAPDLWCASGRKTAATTSITSSTILP